MKTSIMRTLRGFGIAIVVMLAFAVLFNAYAGTLSEERQNEVFIKAIPFVAIFISIILAFICLIVIAAIVLNGRIPLRTYRPIEYLVIAGILLGVLGLFQGWKLFVYQNGFLLLLAAVLLFMVWSHITPMSPGLSKRQPPFVRQAQIIGIVAGVIVWVGCAAYVSMSIKPQPPYGNAQRVWDMMMDDDERAAVEDEFQDEYRFNRIPVALLISLLPAAAVFFGARELADARLNPNRVAPSDEAPAEPDDQSELPVSIAEVSRSGM